MTELREPRFRAVRVARAVLWLQAALLAVTWVAPNAMVASMVLSSGIPDDGSAGWLLIPVVYSAPLLLLVVPGLALAGFWSRARGVRTGVVVWQAVLVGVCASVLIAPGLRLVTGMIAAMPLVLVVEVLAGLYVLAALLGTGRAASR